MKTKPVIQSRPKGSCVTRFNALKVSFAVALMMGLNGCVGYVDGGYDGGGVVATGPDIWLFGGGHDRGHDRAYSHRGAASRGFAHGSGGGGHGGHR